MSRPVIYILDDDPVFARHLTDELGRAGAFETEVFEKPEACLGALAEAPPDLLLAGLRTQELDGVEVSRRVRRTHPHLPVFIVAPRGDTGTAVEALEAGADGYLRRPVDPDELAALVRRALEVGPLIREAASLRRSRRERYGPDALLGDHPRMSETRAFLSRVAGARSAGVLLLGEPGVGKSLAARVIHYGDPTVRGAFVEVNLAALPDRRPEAALLGYVEGAFPGARQDTPGLLEAAAGGTLFLKEVAGMPRGLQARILDVLESRRFRRLGGSRERSVDLRIVASTSRDVAGLLRGGGLSPELFDRLSPATHTLHPLRRMPSVIPELAGHFARTIAEEMGRPLDGLSREAVESLQSWSWPGNVRELRNVLELAVLFADGPLIGVADLPTLGPPRGGLDEDEDGELFGIPAGLTLKEAEADYIRHTLEHMDHRIQDSAAVLGISRKNLWEKRKKYGLLE